MKRRRKHFVAFVLAAFFAFGVLCSTFTAPGQAFASVNGCAQTPGPMALAGCDNPSYLCGFDPASNLLSHGAFSSARSSDLLKNTLGLALGTASVHVPIDLGSPGAREWHVSIAEPRKVSIHLFNSTLNL
jgi:hypothetical protein